MHESVVPKQNQYRLVLVDTWWYWVSMKRHWLIYDGTGSVRGGTGLKVSMSKVPRGSRGRPTGSQGVKG